MSKWINKDLFDKFQEVKKDEKENQKNTSGMRRSEFVWETPEKGTFDSAKTYEGRFIPDKSGNFYQKYYYHMFKSGEKWTFILCNKTHNFDNYCPFCSVTSKLYTGTAADKQMAQSYKRKEKFVGNFYIVNDPRDADREDDRKVNGTVKLYEFPGKVEMKLKEEITDTRNGLGPDIFDPGDGGFNFILKVNATKKDRNGNIWPEYSNSTFARRPEALGTDAEIDGIMEQTIDLMEYVSQLQRTDEEIVNILKAEMVWTFVENEWRKDKGITELNTPAPSPSNDDEDDDIDDSLMGTDVPDETPDLNLEADGDLSDEDLLKELEDI